MSHTFLLSSVSITVPFLNTVNTPETFLLVLTMYEYSTHFHEFRKYFK